MHLKCSNSSSKTSARLFLAVLSMAMLAACSTPTPDASAGTGPVAYLKANTAGGNMGTPGRPRSVLELHVIEGRHTIKPVAQCEQIYSGTALGGGTKRELQVVLCEGDWNNDGEYWLISETGVVSVRRGAIKGQQQTVLEYRLRDVKARAVTKQEW